MGSELLMGDDLNHASNAKINFKRIPGKIKNNYTFLNSLN
jgi:hypothetical protein